MYFRYYYSVMPSSGSFGKSTKGKSSKTSSDSVVITMKSGSTYEGQVNHLNERHGYGIYNVVNGGRYMFKIPYISQSIYNYF